MMSSDDSSSRKLSRTNRSGIFKHAFSFSWSTDRALIGSAPASIPTKDKSRCRLCWLESVRRSEMEASDSRSCGSCRSEERWIKLCACGRRQLSGEQASKLSLDDSVALTGIAFQTLAVKNVDVATSVINQPC